MIEKYKALVKYLEFICNRFDLSVSIHSFTGFLVADKDLANILHPFMIHSNNYCMYIKSNEKLFEKCLNKRCNIEKRCLDVKDTFYGMCYAGVEEYVVPIFDNDRLIATIFVGVFRGNTKTAEKLINRNAKRYGLDLDIMLKHYYNQLSNDVPNINIINSLFKIVAHYLKDIYNGLENKMNHYKENNLNLSNISGADNILAHTLNYINKNFRNDIRVYDIAKYCHCSESYINHIFKSSMKINISRYINKVRVENAKKHLLQSNETIKNIALTVGFNDPNYFSNVFNNLCSISPTEFRKENNSNNNE